MRGSERAQIHAMPPVCRAVRLAFSPYQPYFICIQRTRLMPRKSHADEWKPHSPGMCISLKSLPLLFTTIPWIGGQKKFFFKIAKPKTKVGWEFGSGEDCQSGIGRMKNELLAPPKGYASAPTRAILLPPLSSEGTCFFLMFPFCGLSC